MVVISIKSIDTPTKGTNDMFSSPTKTTKTTKSTKSLKAIATAAAIAALLGACSTQAPTAPEAAPERTATTQAPADPVDSEEEATNQRINPVGSPKPKAQPPTTAAPKPAAPDYVVGACGPAEISDGLDYEVINIKDNDPDGGLVLRTAPSYNQQRIVTISEYSIVYSYGTADSCAIDSKGRTWWYVDAPGIASGWVNAYYLGITPYIEDFHNEGGFEAEVDHVDVDIDNQHLDGELTDAQLYEDMLYDCENGVTDCTEFYALFGSGD